MWVNYYLSLWLWLFTHHQSEEGAVCGDGALPQSNLAAGGLEPTTTRRLFYINKVLFAVVLFWKDPCDIYCKLTFIFPSREHHRLWDFHFSQRSVGACRLRGAVTHRLGLWRRHMCPWLYVLCRTGRHHPQVRRRLFIRDRNLWRFSRVRTLWFCPFEKNKTIIKKIK